VPAYPGETWQCFNVDDVDAMGQTVEALGGHIVRPGEDRPEHQVRASVVADPEGHFIELVGRC
jgi:predicted enzyme related to lactoylglutathione lyase